MSECNFWWRTGEIQWCDMKGDECACGGWDETCDLKAGENSQSMSEMSQDKKRKLRDVA